MKSIISMLLLFVCSISFAETNEDFYAKFLCSQSSLDAIDVPELLYSSTTSIGSLRLIYKDTVKKIDSNLVKAWILSVHAKQETEIYKGLIDVGYTKNHYIFNLRNELYSIIARVDYRCDGTVKYSQTFNEEYSPLVPQSVGKSIFESVVKIVNGEK